MPVCQVPLLDMKVYSKLLAGASWMAEYGDPDTEDWKFMRAFSAYHVLRHDCLGLPEPPEETVKGESRPGTWTCPKVLFTTSTRDDRVHPGHARKMVRALQEEAKEAAPVVYYWYTLNLAMVLPKPVLTKALTNATQGKCRGRPRWRGGQQAEGHHVGPYLLIRRAAAWPQRSLRAIEHLIRSFGASRGWVHGGFCLCCVVI